MYRAIRWWPWIVAFILAGALMYFAGSGCARPNPPPKPKPFTSPAALLFYGYGGRQWSGGLDNMAVGLRDIGYDARCYPYEEWEVAVNDVIRSQVVGTCVVGHSFGGYAAVSATKSLVAAGLPVRLFLLDGSQPSRRGGDFTTAVPISEVIPRVPCTVFCIPTTFILSQWPCPRVVHEGDVELVTTTWCDHLAIDSDTTVLHMVLERAR